MVAGEERHERELRQGGKRRPPAPEWLIEYGLNRAGIDAVHVGGCWAAKASGRCRPATREQATDALRRQVPPVRALPAGHRARQPRATLRASP
ncbi:DUF6233 domain-containing protein [Streptomyces sp. NPDC054783]